MVATLSEMTKLWEKALKKIKTKLDDDRAYDSFLLMHTFMIKTAAMSS